ncbi:MAG: DNA translocase FtsK 4TM domain-containing protein [Alistipes sp.]|nr:DNA translocase FtsK 4TM domain-containing protein [Alistipes sp.]
MATVRKKVSDKERVGRSDSDSLRWTLGLVVFILGLYITAAVVFYFFTWKTDCSILQRIADGSAEAKALPTANPCGHTGASIADKIVGDGFGLFGIVLPVMLTMLGVRIIRRRPLLFHHSVLSSLFILILGSLTLGVAFGDKWDIFTSGWGGACGVFMAKAVISHIGTIGAIIAIVAGWILTGVFINRNFIDKVNAAGNDVVGTGARFIDFFKGKLSPSAQDEDEEPMPDEEPEDGYEEYDGEDEPEPTPQPAPSGNHTSSVFVQPPQPVVPQRTDAYDEFDEEDEEPYRAPEFVINDIYGGQFIPESMRHRSDDDIAESQMEEGDSGRVFSGPVIVPESFGGKQADDSFGPTVISQPFDISAPSDESQEPEEIVYISSDDDDDEPQIAQDESSANGDDLVVNVYENEVKVLDENEISTEVYDPTKDLMNYRKPTPDMLEDYQSNSKVTDEEIYENKTRIEETLNDFGIPIRRIDATVGPTVTLYEIVQAQGVKISKIQGLQNDIAQSLKAESGIRIIAPIPGRGTVGIEVPNRNKQVVSMYSAVCSEEFNNFKAELPIVIGRTIQNKNFVFDLAKMPHLLVAGATGKGKSVGLNAIITSLLYKKHPSQLKLVMIDPKQVEFSLYSKIERHFLAKMASEDEAIITDARKAVYTLNALCMEMDERLKLCKTAQVRNIQEYNEKFIARRLNPQKGHRFLPYIVVVIDEFADLITNAKEVEMPVARLTAVARAAGIHLIIATQRPSVDVITGKIKANCPTRIAFQVTQMNDSRTIIDRPGAEQLIGRGDMLFSKDGELTRIQCALVETNEVERIVDCIAAQQGYPEAYNLPDYTPDSGDGAGSLGSDEPAPAIKYDALFADIARDAVSSGQISTSSIQRNYEVGFNRAGRIMMQLERSGIVGRQEGAKPRAILYHDLPSLEAHLQELGVF